MHNTNVHGFAFNSWGEWLEFVRQEGPNDLSWDKSSSKGFGFTHTNNYTEALELAAKGWFDAEAEARKISNAVMNRIGALVDRDEELYDVEGQGIDIGAFNTGIPECFIRYEQHYAESPGPIVKIVFNIAASAAISKEVMIAKGAAVAGMIECIELSGKTAELWAVCSVDTPWGWRGADQKLVTMIKIKDAGQALDMSRVMFAIGHPSSLRRLWFRWLELQEPSIKNPYRDGYGVPSDISKEDLPESMHHLLGDIYIGKSLLGEPQWEDEAATHEWIIKKLRDMNIRINDATVPEVA